MIVVDREKIKEFEKNTLTEVTEDYFNCIIEQLLKTTSNHIPMTDTECPEDIYEFEEPIVEYNKKQFL